jgi:SAM-dependent methyltransferase
MKPAPSEIGRGFYEGNTGYRDRLEERRQNTVWFKDYFDGVLRHSQVDSMILDAGCGTGITTSHLHDERPKIIGVDFSSLFIEEAKRHGDYFRVMDISKLEFPDAHFDLLCSADAIEHVTDLEAVLKEFRRVLKPGGWLVIQAPNLSCGILSTNYPKTPRAVLNRCAHLLGDLCRTRLKTIQDYQLDTLTGDRDAYSLVSPIWLRRWMKANGFRNEWLTTYSLYFEPRWPVRAVLQLLSLLPVIRYTGGRIVMAAQKL